MELKELHGKHKDEILELFSPQEIEYDSNEWIIPISKSWFGLVIKKLYIYFDKDGRVESVLRL